MELHLPLPNHLTPLPHLPLLRHQQWLNLLKCHGQIQELLGWLSLHPLPAHPEKWLPKFNLDNGPLAEEHINNFMFSINLNKVVEEDAVVQLFPYTFQGAAGSWYFSLPSGSTNSWDAFQE